MKQRPAVLPYTMCVALDNTETNLPKSAGLGSGFSFDKSRGILKPNQSVMIGQNN